MISIIKKPKQNTYTTTCEKCGCIFSYQDTDIIFQSEIDCPVCKAKLLADKKVLVQYQAKYFKNGQWLYKGNLFLSLDECKKEAEETMKRGLEIDSVTFMKVINEVETDLEDDKNER